MIEIVLQYDPKSMRVGYSVHGTNEQVLIDGLMIRCLDMMHRKWSAEAKGGHIEVAQGLPIPNGVRQ